jgi:hypothetical protein
VAIDANTQVVISLSSFLMGVGAFLVVGGGVLWAVLSVTIGGIRDDVHDMRSSIRGMNAISASLTDQIQLLRTDYVVLSGKMENLCRSIDYLSRWISGILPRPLP